MGPAVGVEPRLGRGPVGAKWEVLLVIQDGSVFWLDDDTPHMRYWRRHATPSGNGGTDGNGG